MNRFAPSTFLTASILAFAMPQLASADPAAERVWKTKCASCHGADGKGATAQGKKLGISDMTTAEWQGKFSDDKIIAVTKEGLHRTSADGKKQDMDGFKEKLTDDQITAVAKYVRELKK